MGEYQLVKWWPKWQGLCFVRLNKKRHGSMALIYCWCFYFGFWELRKWQESIWKPTNDHTIQFDFPPEEADHAEDVSEL